MGQRILILGAGFGGLEAATSLREQLDDKHTITLIDRSDHFIIGFSKFEVLFGRRRAEEVKSYYVNLAPTGVRFVHDTITALSLEDRQVRTTAGAFGYDYLIVALGAELAPEATPGFAAGGTEFYSLPGAERLYPVLNDFPGGTILLSILGPPYKCPPAPFEAAFQLHDFFGRLGRRDRVQITMLDPAPVPLPVAPGAAEEIRRRFAERDINLLSQHQVVALEPETRQARLADGRRLAYDLFIGVPLHQPPRVVRESALGQQGWIRVNQETLETAFPGVYAVGDVTHIPVGQGAVPKAGAFAESGARVVVQDIVRRITGRGAPARFEAVGTCFLEFGGGEVAQISANYLGQPQPQVALEGPSPDLRQGKARFEDDRLRRWFRA